MAALYSPAPDITKSSLTTVRARLQGTLDPGIDVRFEVEVSGRGAAPPEYRRSELVVPPAEYSIAPFQLNTYTNEALAAMKVGAALSLQRNAARDLYDLRDLIRAGAHPVAILAKQSGHVLQDYAERSLGKLEGLTYQLARDELLPYLPLDEREQLTEDAWLETTLEVAQAIEKWCGEAAAMQRGDKDSTPEAAK
ncbi:MAG: nucleotidyl transferase AbiEii/AbiGii toxin family protein [Pseudomonadota bacterium]